MQQLGPSTFSGLDSARPVVSWRRSPKSYSTSTAPAPPLATLDPVEISPHTSTQTSSNNPAHSPLFQTPPTSSNQSTQQVGQSSLQTGQSSLQTGQSPLQMGQFPLQTGQSSIQMGQSPLQTGQSTQQIGQQTGQPTQQTGQQMGQPTQQTGQSIQHANAKQTTNGGHTGQSKEGRQDSDELSGADESRPLLRGHMPDGTFCSPP